MMYQDCGRGARRGAGGAFVPSGDMMDNRRHRAKYSPVVNQDCLPPRSTSPYGLLPEANSFSVMSLSKGSALSKFSLLA